MHRLIESKRFRRVLKQTVVIPSIFILLMAVLLGALAIRLIHDLKWSAHSSRVIQHARYSFILIMDIDSALRDYRAGKDPGLIESYHRLLPKVDPAYSELADMVSDNPVQSGKVREIVLVKDKLLSFFTTEASRSQASQPGLLAESAEGKLLMDDFMSKNSAFLSEEESLRLERTQSSIQMSQMVLYLGFGVGACIAIFVGYHVRQKLIGLADYYHKSFVLAEKNNRDLIRSQEALTEQKEWFRVTLASIGDAVVVVDDQGRITFMNAESERLTGWEQELALGHSITKVFLLINEKTREPVENPVALVLREKKTLGTTTSMILSSKHGVEIPVENSTSAIYSPAGNILGAVLVFHDVTKAREIQKALLSHAVKLEQEVAQRTKGLRETLTEMEAFSYTVSHDLRSPLRAMQGYAQAVLEDYRERLDETAVNYLNRIKNAAERLDKLIQDLLAYTRISQESSPQESVDLDLLVREILEQYPDFQAPGVDLAIEGELPRVLGRESALTQIISNLLGNSVKFVAPGVRPRVRIRGEAKGDKVRIWVEDNGIGIAPENHDRAFRIFEQLNNSKLYTGTGVGLAIVKRAVESMNGQVGIVSTPDKGSLFWFELDKG